MVSSAVSSKLAPWGRRKGQGGSWPPNLCHLFPGTLTVPLQVDTPFLMFTGGPWERATPALGPACREVMAQDGVQSGPGAQAWGPSPKWSWPQGPGFPQACTDSPGPTVEDLPCPWRTRNCPRAAPECEVTFFGVVTKQGRSHHQWHCLIQEPRKLFLAESGNREEAQHVPPFLVLSSSIWPTSLLPCHRCQAKELPQPRGQQEMEPWFRLKAFWLLHISHITPKHKVHVDHGDIDFHFVLFCVIRSSWKVWELLLLREAGVGSKLYSQQFTVSLHHKPGHEWHRMEKDLLQDEVFLSLTSGNSQAKFFCFKVLTLSVFLYFQQECQKVRLVILVIFLYISNVALMLYMCCVHSSINLWIWNNVLPLSVSV